MLKRLTFISPYLHDTTRGNAVQAWRKIRELEPAGVTVQAIDLRETPSVPALITRVRLFAPQLVLALHAWRTGPAGVEAAHACGVPLAIAIGGTDISPGLDEPEHRAIVERVFAAAERVILQNALQREAIERTWPGRFKAKLRVVPPAVDVPDLATLDGRDWRKKLGIKAEEKLVLLVAGIRAVKGVREAVALVENLASLVKGLRFVLAGPVIEPEYAKPVLDWVATRPWAQHIENVPFADMPELYAAADLVINTSHAEGVSNAVLEAMACARPLLARDVPGNAVVLEHGKTGALFKTGTEFIDRARTLINDSAKASELGRAARAYVEHAHTHALEGKLLLAACEEALGA